MRQILVLAATAAFFGACSGSGSDTVAPPTIDTSATTGVSASTTSTEVPDVSTTSTVAITSTSTSEGVTTTSDSSTSVPPTTAANSTGLVLTDVGIGPLRFGVGPATSVEFLSGALGDPTSDSGWVPSFTSPFGVCPGTEVRGVGFGPLTVLFGDVDGDRAFMSWWYSAFGAADLFNLETANGIGLGSTTESVLSTHPGTEILPADGPFPASARFDGLYASFDVTGDVSYLSGGPGCGE